VLTATRGHRSGESQNGGGDLGIPRLNRALLVGLTLLACAGLARVAVSAVQGNALYQLSLPLLQRPECRTHTASMVLSVTKTEPRVGEAITVTVQLNNEGCVALGLPLYRLWWENAEPGSISSSPPPLEIVHYLAVPPGGYDEAEFVLRAVAAGEATFYASTSFEVHLGYPGPAYWGACTAPPLTIAIQP